MEKNLNAAISVLCIVVIVSLFLPWVNASSKQVGLITKALTGKRQEGVARITGVQIPIMANREEARLIASIAQVFSPGIQNVDKKSFLVLSIPLLALAFMILNIAYGKKRWTNILFCAIGITIFASALFKIITTDLDKIVLQIKIGIGMWLILYSYLAIGVIGALRLAGLIKKK